MQNMNKVLEGLYIGDIRAAQNYELLQSLGIKHILQVTEQPLQPLYPESFTYLCLKVADECHSNICKYFNQTSAYIQQSLACNEPMLIYCFQGNSASSAILAAYLIEKQNLSFKQAYQQIKNFLPSSKINQGFALQLQQYQLVQEKNRKLKEHQNNFEQSVMRLASQSDQIITVPKHSKEEIQIQAKQRYLQKREEEKKAVIKEEARKKATQDYYTSSRITINQMITSDPKFIKVQEKANGQQADKCANVLEYNTGTSLQKESIESSSKLLKESSLPNILKDKVPRLGIKSAGAHSSSHLNQRKSHKSLESFKVYKNDNESTDYKKLLRNHQVEGNHTQQNNKNTIDAGLQRAQTPIQNWNQYVRVITPQLGRVTQAHEVNNKIPLNKDTTINTTTNPANRRRTLNESRKYTDAPIQPNQFVKQSERQQKYWGDQVSQCWEQAMSKKRQCKSRETVRLSNDDKANNNSNNHFVYGSTKAITYNSFKHRHSVHDTNMTRKNFLSNQPKTVMGFTNSNENFNNINTNTNTNNETINYLYSQSQLGYQVSTRLAEKRTDSEGDCLLIPNNLSNCRGMPKFVNNQIAFKKNLGFSQRNINQKPNIDLQIDQGLVKPKFEKRSSVIQNHLEARVQSKSPIKSQLRSSCLNTSERKEKQKKKAEGSPLQKVAPGDDAHDQSGDVDAMRIQQTAN